MPGGTSIETDSPASTVVFVQISYRSRFTVDDVALSALHARAFGYAEQVFAWGRSLDHPVTITWVGAFDGSRLVGFVQARSTGPEDALLFDTAVDPESQGRGIGTGLVTHAVRDIEGAGFHRVLAEFEPPLSRFYVGRCGFTRRDATTASLSLPRPPR